MVLPGHQFLEAETGSALRNPVPHQWGDRSRAAAGCGRQRIGVSEGAAAAIFPEAWRGPGLLGTRPPEPRCQESRTPPRLRQEGGPVWHGQEVLSEQLPPPGDEEQPGAPSSGRSAH
ncbi:hypothetical protein NDU88_002954 [Pleurodeles waltl]|uniref:Uncharacterized protein n=1 Tax=Pleurodeles waltl TaxID=8319 RepID=A0AAV7VE05_PLEWA|nr:hypothetical protein NDU88_002954 [Pleurodeles waltl]